MQPEELFEAARARARALEVMRPDASEADRLRADCAGWFDLLPEPPLYRRIEDPAVRAARARLGEGQELLARCLALRRAGGSGVDDGALASLQDVVQAHLEALCHSTEGRLTRAEHAWERAVGLERALAKQSAWWSRSTDDALPPVYDGTRRTSRYDPGPDPSLTVRLYCPYRGCGAQQRYRVSPRHSTHQFTCTTCRRPFMAYFGEVRAVEGNVFRIEELGGAHAQVRADGARAGELPVARRDLLAFLYDGRRRLQGVLNLSSGRILLFHRGGPCFVVSAVYGEDAPELTAFRAFRDEVLLPRRLGRAAVRGYYAWGPHAARAVRRSKRLRLAVGYGLGMVHGWLVRKGRS